MCRKAQFGILTAAKPCADGAAPKKHRDEERENDGPLHAFVDRSVGGREHHADNANNRVEEDGSAAGEKPDVSSKCEDAERYTQKEKGGSGHRNVEFLGTPGRQSWNFTDGLING